LHSTSSKKFALKNSTQSVFCAISFFFQLSRGHPVRPSGIHLKSSDRATYFSKNFDLYLTQEEAFHELVQDILENLRGRFDSFPWASCCCGRPAGRRS
jgi:hypothetical protein